MAEDRRDELLQGTVAWVLQHGLGGLSLRPLAAALGTSDRMLVYHFGSKDRLVDEVLAAANGLLLAGVTAAASASPREPAALLRALWAVAAQDSTAPFVRLFFEVYGLALQRPDRYGAALREVAGAWRQAVLERLDGDERTATLVVAAVEGLLLDLLVSGDRARVETALDDLAGRL